MYSNLVPFETVLANVKDDTGITNLQNLYPKIRRLIYRIEKDLGFGGTAILRMKRYSTLDGSIIFDGKTYRLKLPEDMMYLEETLMCRNGMCPGTYRIQGNFMFFDNKRPVEKLNLIYYTLLCDGEGNPVTTENHSEAVAAGISYFLYKPLVFRNKGNRGLLNDLKLEYYDRLAEARGDDVLPSTDAEWTKLAQIMNMSSKDAISYGIGEKNYDNIPDPIEVVEDGGDEDTGYTPPIWSFQFNNLQDDITKSDMITEAWLHDHGEEHSERELLEGKFINYGYLGRIGFAIKTSSPGRYSFTDILMNRLNSVVFDNVYDPVRQIDIYISKEYYTESAVYYKFILNNGHKENPEPIINENYMDEGYFDEGYSE